MKRRWLVLLGLGLLIYGVGLAGQRYGDDLGFIYAQPGQVVLYYFTHDNPNHGWYRPLEAMVYALVQTVWGSATWPLHLFQLGLHLGLVGLIWGLVAGRTLTPQPPLPTVGERLGVRGWSAAPLALAVTYALVAQANAIAVASCDTLSQVLGALTGWLCLWQLDLALRGPRTDRRRYLVAVFWLAVSLLCKESSTGFVLAALGLLAWHRRRQLKALLAYAAPMVVVTFSYLLIRAAVLPAQPVAPEEGYAFHFGPNVLRNLALLGAAAMVPVSSAAVALGPLWLKLLGAVCGLVLLGGAAVGWRGHGRNAAGWLLLGGATLAPMLLLNHVSELYLYNALPAVAVLLGVGWGRLVTQRRGLVVLLGSLLLGHLVSLETKLVRMVDNGVRAQALLRQLEPTASEVADGGTLYLVEPPGLPPKYSVYVLPGFQVLRHGLMRIPQMVQRPGLRVVLIDSGQAAPVPQPGDQVATWLPGGIQFGTSVSERGMIDSHGAPAPAGGPQADDP